MIAGARNIHQTGLTSSPLCQWLDSWGKDFLLHAPLQDHAPIGDRTLRACNRCSKMKVTIVAS